MTLELSRPSERIEPYRCFRDDAEGIETIAQQMPVLLAAGYVPVSMAQTIRERMREAHSPEDVKVRGNWRNSYIDTGDGAKYDGQGNAVIDLDSATLRRLTPQIKLVRSGMPLQEGEFEEARDRDGTLYLTAEQVNEVYGKGWVKRRGVWQPSSTLVGDIWKGTDSFPGLARDQREILPEYAELVASKSREGEVMQTYLDKGNAGQVPIERPWFLTRVNNYSVAGGNTNVDKIVGRLSGVAPEAQRAREQALEQILQE